MSFLRDAKRLIAVILAGATGIIVLLNFAGALPGIDAAAVFLTSWAALLAALALFVGLLSVTLSHLVRVFRRRPDWIYSLVLLLVMLLVIINGIIVWPVPSASGFNYVLFPESLGEPTTQALFDAVYRPLAASLLALLAFFSLSAALRALQRRVLDAVIIVVVAVVVLAVTALPQAQSVPVIGESLRWIESYLVLAGARGLLLGTAIGAVVAGVRVLLGFDQPYIDR